MNKRSLPQKEQLNKSEAGSDSAKSKGAPQERIQPKDASQDVTKETITSSEPWLGPFKAQGGDGGKLGGVRIALAFGYHDGEQDARRDSSSWMVTLADLTALVLAFFVLLYSMSVFKTGKWREIVASITGEISWREDFDGMTHPLGLDSISDVPGVNLDYLAPLLERKLASSDRIRSAVLTRQSDRLVLSLPSELVFDRGRTTINERGQSIIAELSDMIRHLDNLIEVAGHADPNIAEGASVSNWELSLLRAVTVAKHLKKSGYQGSIQAVGYGDSRFGQLSDRLSEDFKERIARRVDIVVHARVGDWDGEPR